MERSRQWLLGTAIPAKMTLAVLLATCTHAPQPDRHSPLAAPRRSQTEPERDHRPATHSVELDREAPDFAQIPKFSGEQLRDEIAYWLPRKPHWIGDLLMEAGNRPKKPWSRFLRRCLDRHPDVAQVETVLRRVTGQPELLEIQLESDRPIEAIFPDLPVVRFRLRNRGSMPLSIFHTWRVAILSPRAEPIETLPLEEEFGGFISVRIDRHHYQLGETRSGAAEVTALGPPGAYTGTVELCPWSFPSVLGDRFPDGIVFRSKPVDILWKPAIVTMTPAVRKDIELEVERLLREPSIAIIDRRPKTDHEGPQHALGHHRTPADLECEPNS